MEVLSAWLYCTRLEAGWVNEMADNDLTLTTCRVMGFLQWQPLYFFCLKLIDTSVGLQLLFCIKRKYKVFCLNRKSSNAQCKTYKSNLQWISDEARSDCVWMSVHVMLYVWKSSRMCVISCCMRAYLHVCVPLWWVSAVCEFINQSRTLTVRMWVWIWSSSCCDGSASCDLTVMTGTSMCVSIYLLCPYMLLHKADLIKAQSITAWMLTLSSC